MSVLKRLEKLVLAEFCVLEVNRNQHVDFSLKVDFQKCCIQDTHTFLMLQARLVLTFADLMASYVTTNYGSIFFSFFS